MSPLLRSAALVLFSAANALGQAATPTLNPLNEFIGAAGSAASVIRSAHAIETAAAASASAASAAAAASPIAKPAAKPANSHKNLIIAVVCGVVGALILIAILLGVCCFLKRHGGRRRKHRDTAIDDDEKTIDHTQPIPPLNPGRTYAPLSQNRGVISASQSPKAPMLAAVGTSGLYHETAQRDHNPFVPVPPSPRKPAYSNSAFIDTSPHDSYRNSYANGGHESYSTAQPYLADASPLRTTAPHSRSNSRPRSGVGLPSTTVAEEPSTPIGLSRIGEPYDEMHVHVLQNDAPSSDLRQSLHNSDPVPRHHTPPLVPSRSPARRFAPVADTSYQSSTTGSSTTYSGSDEDWRHSHVGPSGGGHGWAPSPIRYSNGTSGTILTAPPVPWDHAEPRRHSADRPLGVPAGSNGGATGWTPGHDRQGSATSINGQPRRLRFSDLQADGGHGHVGGSGAHDGRDDHRHPPVVGEAM